MTSRKETLEKLIAFDGPIEECEAALMQFPWDSYDDLVILTKSDCLNAISLVQRATIQRGILQNWAEVLEAREDVGFPPQEEADIVDFLFEMANPQLVEERVAEIPDWLLDKWWIKLNRQES